MASRAELRVLALSTVRRSGQPYDGVSEIDGFDAAVKRGAQFFRKYTRAASKKINRAIQGVV
jgi:hypothetical protein